MIAAQTIKMIDTFLADKLKILLLDEQYCNFLTEIKSALLHPTAPTEHFYQKLIEKINEEITQNDSAIYFYRNFLVQLKNSLKLILERHQIHNYSKDDFLRFRAHRFYSKLDQYIEDVERYHGEVVVPFSQSLYPEIIEGVCSAYVYATGEKFIERNSNIYTQKIGRIPQQTFTPQALLKNKLNRYHYALLPELLPIEENYYRYKSTNPSLDNAEINLSTEFDSLTDTLPTEYFNHSAHSIMDNILGLFEKNPTLSVLVLNYREPLKLKGHSVCFTRDQNNYFYFVEPTFCTTRFKNKDDLKNWFIKCYPRHSEKHQFEYFIQSMSLQEPSLFSRFMNIGRGAVRVSANVMNHWIDYSLSFFESENPKAKIYQEYLASKSENSNQNNIEQSKKYCIDDLEISKSKKTKLMNEDIPKKLTIKEKKYAKDDIEINYKTLEKFSVFKNKKPNNSDDCIVEIGLLRRLNY